jgi:hypothetical protein
MMMQRSEIMEAAIASVCEAKRGFLAVQDAGELITALAAAGMVVVPREGMQALADGRAGFKQARAMLAAALPTPPIQAGRG